MYIQDHIDLDEAMLWCTPYDVFCFVYASWNKMD